MSAESLAPRVLIVDPSDEGREVLCELLGRSGLAATAVSEVAHAKPLLRDTSFAVIVIDSDATTTADCGPIRSASARTGAAIVVAGTNRPPSSLMSGVRFVRKPYHYRELVHKITAALGESDTQARAAA